MRIRFRTVGTLLAVALAAAACGGDDDDGTGDDGTGDDSAGDDSSTDDGGGAVDQQVLVDFADQVVIPTYQLLADRAIALDDAAAALDDERSDESLDAARQAWADTRVPWEESEAFLFGPVSAQGWDPAMDSWPLNKDDLDAVLASGDELTQDFIRNLPETQKGFHTIEYLLWGDDSQKTAADFDDREIEYLLALTEELTLITTDLATSWTDGVGGQAAYRDVFTTAGDSGNTAYGSIDSAVQEMLGGMAGICDEVANGKIAEPFGARDPNLVESQYSFNSLLDFQDNMRSVLNAYTGDFPAGETEGSGLDDFVAEVDPDLDARFKGELDDAISALGEIPSPFPAAIQDPGNDAAIEAAQAAIATVQSTIEGDLTAVLLQ
ncbi:MAG TPA: imelysin family protein [Kofleriaceae bacterium]|nr:imelysin family protein [Kofleriaceae bacterium]